MPEILTPAEARMRAYQSVTEKDFQAQVVRTADMFGWLVYHTHDSRRSNPGFPDLVLVEPHHPDIPAGTGQLIFAELKTEKGQVRMAQHLWMRGLWNAGKPEAHVWRPSQIDEITERLKKGRKP